MPAPANANELLDLIQKSGVVEEAKLRAYVQKLTDAGKMPADAPKLAGFLVRDAILTYFQAEQLLHGKYKRFSIGKYKVLEKLGAGGMAQVFLCEHKLMRRRVAIKVLPTAKAEDPSSLDRFYREAKAIAAVDHPNIVRAYDIDQDENLHFLVMEYVDGINLQDLIKKFGPLDITRACHYIYGAAVGLQHAHEMGLVHRDIKPGNILIDRSGVVKILDMGLARFFHDEEDALTKKYDENVLGTADYLAPEQALDSHAVDIRADIYSLGATFYYLLTGSALFPEGSVAQKLIWHQNRQPKPVRSLRPEVPDAVVAVVDKMMAKDVARRYQIPAEIMAALAPWVATPIAPPAEREMPQVSPAAGGGGRGPVTSVGMIGPAAVSPDAPTVIAMQGTLTNSVATVPDPLSGPAADTVGSPAVWESLDGDTQTVAQGDTDRAVPRSEPASKKYRSSERTPARFPFLLVGVCVLALAGSATGVYFAFFKKPPPHGNPVAVGPKQLVVSSKAGGGDTFSTLGKALETARSGDTILIADEKVKEFAALKLESRHKDLTIESGLPDGKPAVIEMSGKTMIDVQLEIVSVEGIHLKNLVFDGNKAAATGIRLSGICKGALLENVTVQNAASGVWFRNASGASDRPIVLNRVRTHSLVMPTEKEKENSGVFISAQNVDTNWVKIENCRFEGPGRAGIKVNGATRDLTLTGNRFYKMDDAVLFARPDQNVLIKALLDHNTVVETKAGILFDLTVLPPPPKDAPPPPIGKFELLVQQNYFAQTNEVGKVEGASPPPPGKVDWKDNGQGPGGNPGCASGLQTANTPPQFGTNPADDATFLRFPSGRPVVNGQPVGAP